MRESIVIQLGNYSNHVGSHLWNIQSASAGSGTAEGDDNAENFEGNRLYRRSNEASSGYVPRLLMGDLAENTGHVLIAGESTVATGSKARAAEHAENSDDLLLWDGATKRVQKDFSPVHPFQLYQQSSAQMLLNTIDPTSREHDFFSERVRSAAAASHARSDRPDERSINSWCDYMGTAVHARSYLDLPLQYTSSNFDNFASGLQHDRSSFNSVVDSYLESFRYFAEECDTLTSVHVLADCFDGFSILAKELVQEIREDYRGVAMPVWSVADAPPLLHAANSASDRMKNTLRDLSFSYSAAAMLDCGASAIIPLSAQEASTAMVACYSQPNEAAAAGSGAGRSAFNPALGLLSSSSSSSSGGKMAYPVDARSLQTNYFSSSSVAVAIDGVLSMDMYRNSPGTSAVDFLNSSGSGRGSKSTSSGGGGAAINATSSSGDMWEILYHSTNAGRFPVLNMETSLPLSSSPNALMQRIEARFQYTSSASATSRANHTVADTDEGRFMASISTGRMNPYLSSFSAAHRYASQLERAAGSRDGKAAAARAAGRQAGKVREDHEVDSFFGGDDNNDDNGYYGSTPDDLAALQNTNGALSNVLCVRGALANSEFGFDKYVWTKAAQNAGYDDYGKDLGSGRYFVTRCLQRQAPMRAPASFPAAVAATLILQCSDRDRDTYNREMCAVTSVGADASVPVYLAAHAVKWNAASRGGGGALLSQLNKVGMAEEDAKEIAEVLMKTAGNYKDDLM